MKCEYIKPFEDKQRCLYNKICQHQLKLDGMVYCGNEIDIPIEIEMVSKRLEQIIERGL